MTQIPKTATDKIYARTTKEDRSIDTLEIRQIIQNCSLPLSDIPPRELEWEWMKAGFVNLEILEENRKFRKSRPDALKIRRRMDDLLRMELFSENKEML